MKKLFIIGNGFDLYHGFNTSYKSFYKYIKSQNQQFFKMNCKVFLGQFKPTDRLWSVFEEEISAFDYNQFVLEDDIYNDQTNQIELAKLSVVKANIKVWKILLDHLFREWIKTTVLNVDLSGKRFKDDSVFMNFNYTDTLQRLYQVNDNKILYIHNSIKDDNLIYGHGVKFNFEEMLEHYGLVKDGIAEFTEMQLRDIDVQFTVGRSLFKDVQKIIESHREFEKTIKGVNEIIVIGHSMSEVDFPYFEWIRDCLPKQSGL